MLKHLLVPLDGRDSAEAVLPMLRRLDAMGASEVTLLRTEMPVVMDEYAAVSEAALGQARLELNELRLRVSDLAATVHTVAQIGPAASTVMEVAEEIGATMILASTPRRARLVRFLFGNVAERLVQRSRIPVLSVPPPGDLEQDPDRGGALRSILVPLDGGQGSRSVLPFALEAARSSGARILLLSVLSGTRADSDEFEGAEERLYSAGAECAAAGVDFSVLMEYGDPAEQILSVCRDRRVDWIAMATRGRSSLSRWLTPSATLRVLRRTGRPLLTIRAVPSASPAGLGAPSSLGRH